MTNELHSQQTGRSQTNELSLLFEAVKRFTTTQYRSSVKRISLTLSDGELLSLPVPESEELGTASDPEPATTCTHSRSFRVIIWGGRRFTFTALQSRAVAVLWEAWQSRELHECEEEELLNAAESESARLYDLFKDNPAWGVMIIKTGVKMYSLCDPETLVDEEGPTAEKDQSAQIRISPATQVSR